MVARAWTQLMAAKEPNSQALQGPETEHVQRDNQQQEHPHSAVASAAPQCWEWDSWDADWSWGLTWDSDWWGGTGKDWSAWADSYSYEHLRRGMASSTLSSTRPVSTPGRFARHTSPQRGPEGHQRRFPLISRRISGR
ncbi:unnamed protein product [Prorocentrum cordatum]|uniref:Uncharacterized protein n=1 Tax=Prorocentrum cordatum TaxID=2364126 RepID=A0ABN9X012_9DINO|nr:unnamed protein product [Polarella glacialis]